jgi:hypothetical protein
VESFDDRLKAHREALTQEDVAADQAREAEVERLRSLAEESRRIAEPLVGEVAAAVEALRRVRAAVGGQALAHRRDDHVDFSRRHAGRLRGWVDVAWLIGPILVPAIRGEPTVKVPTTPPGTPRGDVDSRTMSVGIADFAAGGYWEWSSSMYDRDRGGVVTWDHALHAGHELTNFIERVARYVATLSGVRE